MANTRPRVGKNPRAYEGVRAINPPDFVKKTRDPKVGIGAGNPLDFNYDIGTFWLNETNFNLWMLVDKEVGNNKSKNATWIQLNSTLVGDITEIRDNNGLIVTPDAGGAVDIVGDLSVGIYTSRTGANELTISSTTGNPFLQTLTGNDSIVVAGAPADQNIDFFGSFALGLRVESPGANTLEIVTRGGNRLMEILRDDAATIVTATAPEGRIDILGGNEINTVAGANSITINLDNTITLGGVTPVGPAEDALTVASGDVTIQSGNLDIPGTDAGLDQGVISIDDTKFFTSFRDPAEAVTNTNWFLGFEAGTVGSDASSLNNIGLGNQVMQNLDTAVFNIGIGPRALQNLTGGFGNIAIGFATLQTPLVNAENSVVIGNLAGDGFIDCINNVIIGHESCGSMALGQDNTVVGYQALSQSDQSTKTIAIGHHAALLYTTNESNNIIIGNPGTVGDNNTIRVGVTGTGIGQQDKCFVAGIRDGVASGSSFRDVIIDENDQLISAPEGFAFLAYRNSTVDNVTGAGANYITQWDQTEYNFGGSWNGTDTFTAPIDCIVELFSTVRMTNITSAMTRGLVRFSVTGGIDWMHNFGSPGAIRSETWNDMSMSIKNAIMLDQGDTVQLRVQIQNGAADTADFGAPNAPTVLSTWFGGRLLYALL